MASENANTGLVIDPYWIKAWIEGRAETGRQKVIFDIDPTTQRSRISLWSGPSRRWVGTLEDANRTLYDLIVNDRIPEKHIP